MTRVLFKSITFLMILLLLIIITLFTYFLFTLKNQNNTRYNQSSTNNNASSDENFMRNFIRTTPSQLTPPIIEFIHHNNSELSLLLKRYALSYPHLAQHQVIGRSVLDGYIESIIISDNPTVHEPGEPEMKLIGTIHGNEVVGRELLLHLIDKLLKNYHNDPMIRQLVDGIRLHIVPAMNLDGYAMANEGDCYGIKGRENAEQVDLNRNFPDQFIGMDLPISSLQPETQSIINWTLQHPFVLSAGFHGGALVVNYPFDNNAKSINRYTKCPDDEIFKHLSLLYAQSHPVMKYGRCQDNCKNSFLESFEKGITNGAEWYPISGGMQDWNYIVANCFEITVELGCKKFPLASELEKYWEENVDSLIKFISSVHLGVSGFVHDEQGNAIDGAIISVDGIKKNVTTYQMGDYWRLLKPGKWYNVTASKLGYHFTKHTVNIDPEIGFAKLNFTLLTLN